MVGSERENCVKGLHLFFLKIQCVKIIYCILFLADYPFDACRDCMKYVVYKDHRSARKLAGEKCAYLHCGYLDFFTVIKSYVRPFY